MINGKKVLAIIPARGGSKGLPGKNIMELCGKPLIGWPIEAALRSKYIDRVVVTTDDEAIALVAKREGAEVPFMRPQQYATDESPSSEAILHALEYCESESNYDYIVLLEPTSPLTESSDVDDALLQLIQSSYLSIVGIADVEGCHPEFCVERLKDKKIIKFGSSGFQPPKRRQEIKTVYSFDGSLYISDVNTYKKNKTFYHEATMGYQCKPWKKFEIDTFIDFLVVESMMKNRELLRKKYE
jgi:N-acylneuraminate cytidylyltransferase/CMP-N,N'-diacetyllegionaminic acid synthase